MLMESTDGHISISAKSVSKHHDQLDFEFKLPSTESIQKFFIRSLVFDDRALVYLDSGLVFNSQPDKNKPNKIFVSDVISGEIPKLILDSGTQLAEVRITFKHKTSILSPESYLKTDKLGNLSKELKFESDRFDYYTEHFTIAELKTKFEGQNIEVQLPSRKKLIEPWIIPAQLVGENIIVGLSHNPDEIISVEIIDRAMKSYNLEKNLINKLNNHLAPQRSCRQIFWR